MQKRYKQVIHRRNLDGISIHSYIITDTDISLLVVRELEMRSHLTPIGLAKNVKSTTEDVEERLFR